MYRPRMEGLVHVALFAQPLVTTSSIRQGAEMLVRQPDPRNEWHCPGWVHKQTPRIGDQLVEASMKAAAACPGTVWINVGPAQLCQPWWPGWLAAVANRTNTDPTRVVIEIVETPTVRIDRFVTARQALRAAGFAVAVDDYASGASTLERVALLRPDWVKLEMSPDIGAHAAAVRGVCPETRLVVERIETAADAAAAVRDARPRLLQGHLFGKAEPIPGQPLYGIRLDTAA